MAKVYLSPSMQEWNIGAGKYGAEEIYCNLIADQTQQILIKHGVGVKRNRPDMTLAEIVTDSNIYDPDLHFAIHTNASGKSPNTTVQGCAVFMHAVGGEREVFSKILYARMSKLTPWPDLGVRLGRDWFGPGKDIYELARTTAPAALIELDFHDHLGSVTWLLQNSQSIAQEMAYSVLEYFKIPIKVEVDYSVQIKELSDQVDELKAQVTTLNTRIASVKNAYVGMGKYLV